MAIKHESGGVISANGDIFHFDPYTNVWSRILIRAGRQQGFLREIRIQITPTFGWDDPASLNEVKERKIKVFDPPHSAHEKYTGLLPCSVYEKMVEYYPTVQRSFLLDKDILRFINLEVLLKFSLTREDGVPFKMCSTLYPNTDSLITRLESLPELYEIPHALKVYKEKKLS